MLGADLSSVSGGGCSGVCSEGAVEKGELGESAAEGDVENRSVGGAELFLSGSNSEGGEVGGEGFAGVTEKLAREGGFAHSSEGEEFCEADGFPKVGVDKSDGLRDGLLVTG